LHHTIVGLLSSNILFFPSAAPLTNIYYS